MTAPRLLIRVIVDADDGTKVAEYVFDMNDFQERRTFAEQMTNAYLAGQVVTTYADEYADRTLVAAMAPRWLKPYELEPTP